MHSAYEYNTKLSHHMEHAPIKLHQIIHHKHLHLKLTARRKQADAGVHLRRIYPPERSHETENRLETRPSVIVIMHAIAAANILTHRTDSTRNRGPQVKDASKEAYLDPRQASFIHLSMSCLSSSGARGQRLRDEPNC